MVYWLYEAASRKWSTSSTKWHHRDDILALQSDTMKMVYWLSRVECPRLAMAWSSGGQVRRYDKMKSFRTINKEAHQAIYVETTIWIAWQKVCHNNLITYGNASNCADKRSSQEAKARGICENVLYVDIRGKTGFSFRIFANMYPLLRFHQR